MTQPSMDRRTIDRRTFIRLSALTLAATRIPAYGTPGEEGLKDLLAIEAIYQAAGTPIA